MFEIDNLTIVLLTVLTSLLVYIRFFARPSPLVHPLLLGKQSDVSSVRKQGESGVYRSWATGQGSPLQVRPANSLKTVHDIVQVKGNGEAERCILDVTLTEEALSEILLLLPHGLRALFPHHLSTSPTSPTPILTLLPPSPVTALPLLLLALSVPPSLPLIVLPHPKLLNTALAKTSAHPQPGIVVVHVGLLDDIIEQVWEDCEDKVGVVVVGDEKKEKIALIEEARRRGMNVRWWEEIWAAAEKDVKNSLPGAVTSSLMANVADGTLADPHFQDVHSYFYVQPESSEGQAGVVKLTHLNITAGIAATLSLFPADKRPSDAAKDVVGSAVRLDSPFGMTLALATIWSGAGFRMFGSPTPDWDEDLRLREEELEAFVANKDHPKPTILFLTPQHHSAMISVLHQKSLSVPFGELAIRHKLPSIKAGHVSRDTLSDKYVWTGLRSSVLGGLVGDRLRAVIVVGRGGLIRLRWIRNPSLTRDPDTPSMSLLSLSHLLLSLPVTRLFPSPYSASPIFVSHFYDLQSPLEDVKSHTGPPATNTEVLLKGPGTEKGQEIEGRIWIRGPGVLERVPPVEGGVVEGWTDVEVDAKVQTNGTFIVR
ncbi:hypothetical protein P7C73_g3360, partial [Tremellales sp. Uapishka_1]